MFFFVVGTIRAKWCCLLLLFFTTSPHKHHDNGGCFERTLAWARFAVHVFIIASSFLLQPPSTPLRISFSFWLDIVKNTIFCCFLCFALCVFSIMPTTSGVCVCVPRPVRTTLHLHLLNMLLASSSLTPTIARRVQAGVIARRSTPRVEF